jgi:antimicrobial peptide system SdpA family protein
MVVLVVVLACFLECVASRSRSPQGDVMDPTRKSSSAPPYRGVGVFTLGLISACLLLGLYAVDASRSINALEVPFQPKFLLQQLMPQGWAFFTRDPREERLHVYAETARGWVSADPGPHASWQYAMGFDRRPRVHGVELALLLAQFRQAAWQECKQNPVTCLATVETAAMVVNTSPQPAFCGPLGIVRQVPVPWAWARATKPVTMPSQILKVDVQC